MQEAKYQINQLFGSSYIKALMQVFPEIGLKEIKFRFAPSICFTFIFLTTTNSLFYFLYLFSSSFFPSCLQRNIGVSAAKESCFVSMQDSTVLIP